ncbi:MAG: carbon-nitrogen hydrolase family protein [Planctomycetota bacterium]|nr:carbon-nitrogen hydrolase family protein [Planctomycetota bacterium]MDA1211490.1 carbon-nitrogen hydrolase family protein [Planctomycetota bacterium]
MPSQISRYLAIVVVAFLCRFAGANDQPDEISLWQPQAYRDEIKPEFYIEKGTGRNGGDSLVIQTDERPKLQGFYVRSFPVDGGKHYRFEMFRRVTNVAVPRQAVFVRVLWHDDNGKPVYRDKPVIGPYHAKDAPELTTGEYLPDRETDAEGWTRLSAVYRAPSDAKNAVVELHSQWISSAKVEWSGCSVTETDEPEGRKVRLAAVHYIPTGKTPMENCKQFAPLIADAAKQKADLVVLPETLTHTNTGLTYADVAESIPGPSTEYFGTLAKKHNLHLVVGLDEKADHLVYNVAVLIGPDGKIIGKYRKVCLPRGEVEAGVAPGDEYPVFDTQFGKVGMMVCYDGFFPEVARELSNNGAEVIAFPVAGCNPMLAAARACENHVYVVSSTYCDVSLNWMITGIYGHAGEILAQATTWGTVTVTEVDLDQPTIWANIGDFKAQLLRHRPLSAPEQVRQATTK